MFRAVVWSSLYVVGSLAATCSDRGGCTCDCSWANSQTCTKDDGSCCYGCCCGTSPTPSPPTPSPPPAIMTLYCPKATDLTAAYGSPTLFNQGWTIHGGGAAATKSAFNLLGGYAEFDVEFAAVPTGVNANIYTLSPSFGSSAFNQNYYCDGAKTGSQWCLEVDWVETNGNCGGATTLHTIEGHSSGCDAGGCQTSYYYNGKPNYHVKISHATDGKWTTVHDGKTIGPNDLNPKPQTSDWNTVASTMSAKGAVIYSSQWTGWVPLADCGTSGDLNNSTFSIKNLKIYGAVVQGPIPSKC